MARAVNRIPVFGTFYTGMFLLGLTLWPIAVAAVMAERPPLPRFAWPIAVAGVAGMLALLGYVQRRCSTERLSFWRGLVVIASCMTTGWVYFSMIFVFPALLATFVACLALAVYGDLRGDPGRAATWFHGFVAGFYAIRMRRGRTPQAAAQASLPDPNPRA
jgi:hypothetical protein